MASNVSEVKRQMKDGLLSCAICSEVYKTPKVLPCLHSFCECCLERWLEKNDGKLTCPNCRLRCLLPTDGVKGLQTNFHLTELIEYVESLSDARSQLCKACHVNQAVSHCPECCQNLCRHCSLTHASWTESKGHKIISLQQQHTGRTCEAKASKKVSYLYCPNHMENPTIAYCTTCETPICRTCAAGKHRDHAHKTIQQAAEADQNVLKFLKRELEQAQQKVLARQDDLSKTCDTMETIRVDLETKIERHTQYIIENVFKKQEELKNDLKTQITERQQAIKSQLEILEDDGRSLTSAVRLTEGVMQSEGFRRGLSTNKAIHRHINYLLTKTCIFSDDVTRITFKPNFDFLEQRLGEIVTSCDSQSNGQVPVDDTTKGSSGVEDSVKVQQRSHDLKEMDGFKDDDGVFSVGGGTVRILGKSGKGKGEFTFPNGLAVNPSDELVVADMDNHRVQILNWDGKPFEPSNVAVSTEGIYFITDIANGQIVVCDGDSHLLTTFGHEESLKPDGVALTKDGFVIVSDLQKAAHCLRKYTVDGRHVAVYGRYGTGPGEFNCPSSLAVNSQNQILVSDGDNNRIQVLDTEGCYVSSFGGDQLSGPGGIDVDFDDNVYVCDDAAKVLKYDKQGKFLETVVQEADIVPFYVSVKKSKPTCLAISEGCNNIAGFVELPSSNTKVCMYATNRVATNEPCGKNER
ncbi:tripartite motif-containing protein 2-like [Ptychodera flava]|uniref:tripartite motif-containing protein 2-like n=1 Tax=Ptychodera flava TaxID=63121 RepID=UPI00396AAEFA